MIEKPSKNEDEYFARQEFEKKRQWEKEREAKLAKEERARLRELHHMKCPKCGMDLIEVELHEITLDRCVNCNGTWFDEGEMEHVLEKEKKTSVLSKVMAILR